MSQDAKQVASNETRPSFSQLFVIGCACMLFYAASFGPVSRRFSKLPYHYGHAGKMDKAVRVFYLPLMCASFSLGLEGALDQYAKSFGGTVPNVVRSPLYCVHVLMQLDGAKAQWALENKKLDTDTVTITQLQPYMSVRALFCEKGGTHRVTTVGAKPTCTVPGHTLNN